MATFNVRVYGLLIRAGQLLVVDEERGKRRFTKLPGGGMEWGEGTMDCLRRELREEMHIEITQISHFYTTDFFVASAFDTQAQLISVYYTFETSDAFIISEAAFDFSKAIPPEKLCFRWISVSEMNADTFTFPVDKHVCALIKNRR